MNLAKKHVPHSELHATDGDRIQIALKQGSLKDISALIKELEDAKAKLDIISLGISSPTIEDVFMKYVPEY